VKTNFDLVSLFQMLKVAVSQYQSNTELERHTALKEEYRNKIGAFEKMLYTTEMILQNTLKGKLMFPPTFEKRVKDFKSFYEKTKQKEQKEGFIADPFTRFTDVAGLRIIFYNAVDLQKAVDLLLATNDFIDVKTGSNLVADDKSKTYGYRAVHFDVKLNEKKRLHLEEYQMLLNTPCEVQFKTIFAHSWSKVYHALSYKQMDEMDLSTREQQQLDIDFKEAAKNLESIEQQITDLCAKYHPSTKTIPNAN
jgi:ppGpp synthetase/RelA/SpoT-type nucleotidyltranferase